MSMRDRSGFVPSMSVTVSIFPFLLRSYVSCVSLPVVLSYVGTVVCLIRAFSGSEHAATTTAAVSARAHTQQCFMVMWYPGELSWGGDYLRRLSRERQAQCCATDTKCPSKSRIF